MSLDVPVGCKLNSDPKDLTLWENERERRFYGVSTHPTDEGLRPDGGSGFWVLCYCVQGRTQGKWCSHVCLSSYLRMHQRQGKQKGVVAVKCIKRSRLTITSMENLLTEIKVMKQLQHEHIVHLAEFEVSRIIGAIPVLRRIYP